MKTMKIATTLAEILNYTDFDFVKAVSFYEGTGFRYLDFSFYHMVSRPDHPLMKDDWKDVIRAVKAEADRLGLTFVQAHLPAVKLIEEGREKGLFACKRAIEACGMLGIENAVIHSSFGEGEFYYPKDKDAYFEANLPFFRELIPEMETWGVNVLLENSCEVNTNGRFFPMTGRDLNEMTAYLGHPRFGAIWDIGHAHIQGLDQRDEMVTMGKNLKAVHIHDNNGRRDQHQQVFNGSLDWDSFMRGLVDSDFEGAFTFEIDGHLPFRKEDPQPLKDLRLTHKKEAVTRMHKTAVELLALYGIQGE